MPYLFLRRALRALELVDLFLRRALRALELVDALEEALKRFGRGLPHEGRAGRIKAQHTRATNDAPRDGGGATACGGMRIFSPCLCRLCMCNCCMHACVQLSSRGGEDARTQPRDAAGGATRVGGCDESRAGLALPS